VPAYEPIWIYPPKNPPLLQKIIAEFNIHPTTAQILLSRGFTDLEEIHEFLYAKLPNLYDPSLFPEIDRAVNRILTALENR
jgi:single-stranded-DNA-specific exonuclease